MSEYIIQLVHIWPNKSIQNFLEASSMLCKYTSFVYFSCTKIKEKFRMGGIHKEHIVQTLIQSKARNQSYCITTTILPRALASPGLHNSSNTDSAKSLSNLFECLTTFTIRNEFPDIQLEFPLLQFTTFAS